MAVVHADFLIGPFLRGLPSLLMGIFLVWRQHTLDQVQPGSSHYVGRRAILSFVAAGVFSTIGLFLYYFAIQVGGVIITTPVLETWVIWGTLIAWFFLREPLRGSLRTGWVLIAVGLSALILGQLWGQPLSPSWYWAIPLATLTAISYGGAGVLWRDGQLRGVHQSMAILLQFVSSIAVALIGLAIAGRLALIVTTPWQALAALLASGVLSGIMAIYCIFTALRLMEVARVYAISSLTPLVATLFAHFFLGEYWNLPMLAGVVLVSVGVTLTQLFRPAQDRQV